MSQQELIKHEHKIKALAEKRGWTDIHGGIADGGAFLRGLPPHNKRGLMEAVPDFTKLEIAGLMWHKLDEKKLGDRVVLVLGASCYNGIGVIARWTRGEGDEWEADAIDMEVGLWDLVKDTQEWHGIIPLSPPTVWDDK